MSFALYMFGFIVMLVGLAWGATVLNVPTTWIAIGCTVLIGLGVLVGVTATRQRDPSS